MNVCTGSGGFRWSGPNSATATQRVEVWLLVDTGADNALTLPDTMLQKYPGVVSVNAAGSGRTRGIGGTVQSTQTWVRQFRIFDLELQDVPVNFEPAAAEYGGPAVDRPRR